MSGKHIPTRKPQAESSRASASVQAAAEHVPSGAGEIDGVEIARRARDVYRYELARILTTRRFELLPPVGEGSPVTKAQGRDHGESTNIEGLTDLISSISHMGVLQPILVEENVADDGTVTRTVVAGERRLRAVRQGHLDPAEEGNPHFQHIPAVIVKGPVAESEVRSWQLIENLARDDLRPGELAAALLFERCAILTAKLSSARMQAINNNDQKLADRLHIPAEVANIADPIQRFEALEKIRGTLTSAAAPWHEVLTQLGMNLSERKARQLVAAFKALPRHISDEMDAHKVALHTRAAFVDLRRGREEAADEIWASLNKRTIVIPRDTIPPDTHEIIVRTPSGDHKVQVPESQKPGDIEIGQLPPKGDLQVLTVARGEDGEESFLEFDGEPVVKSGDTRLLHAATQVALSDPELPAGECVQRATEAHMQANAARHKQSQTHGEPADKADSGVTPDNAEGERSDDDTSLRGAPSITPTLTALRSLIKEVSEGCEVSRYDRGSLQLLCQQLLTKLQQPT